MVRGSPRPGRSAPSAPRRNTRIFAGDFLGKTYLKQTKQWLHARSVCINKSARIRSNSKYLEWLLLKELVWITQRWIAIWSHSNAKTWFALHQQQLDPLCTQATPFAKSCSAASPLTATATEENPSLAKAASLQPATCPMRSVTTTEPLPRSGQPPGLLAKNCAGCCWPSQPAWICSR